MADKRISQLIERTDIANNDVLPIVASGATTTNKVTVSTLQDWMQDNLDVGVTSVGLSVPSAFTVSGSPVTTSGNITISGAGTTAQYIRGDGSLADFPQGGGGGASVSYYLNGSVSQGTIGGIAYREMNKVPVFGAGTDITISSNGYIASFITDAGDPSLLEIPGGNWNFETYLSASSGGGSPTFYIELYKVNSGGTATLIASNSTTPESISLGTNINPYFSALAVPTTSLTLTDRLAIRIYVTPAGRTITLHTENGHLCQIITTFTTGLTALNGLTAQVQNFATGTSGSDFNISSSSSTHTFNLPDASASNRGAVTTGSQVFGGVKTFANGLSLPSAGGSNQVTRLVNIGTLHEGSATLNQIGFNSANNIYFGKGLSNGGVLQWTNSAVRYYTLPDADGTIALASQLGAYLPLAGGTLTGALNGTSSVFSGDVQSGTRLIAAASSQSILLTPNSGGTTNRIESVGTLPLALVSGASITLAAGGTTPQITLATNGAVTLTGALGGTSASFTGDVSGRNLIAQDGFGLTAGNFQVGGISGNRFYIYNGTLAIDNITISPSTGITTFARAISGTSATFSSSVTAEGTFIGKLNAVYQNSSTNILNVGADQSMYGGTNSDGGVFVYGNNKLHLSTNSARRLTVDGSGNVGIGTASPGQKLAVSDSGGVTRVLVENTGNAAAGAGLQMLVSSSGTTVGNGTIRTDNADNMQFFNIGGERMRITSAGNVGIGTASPTTYSLAGRHLEVNDAGGGYAFIHNNTTAVKSFYAVNNSEGSAGLYTFSDHFLKLGTNNTERMRITSGGSVLIGHTAPTYSEKALIQYAGTGNQGLHINQTGSTGANDKILFSNGNGIVGYIRTDGSATSYVTASDYRLKEDLQEINGLEKVSALKVYDYQWKNSEDRMDGVLAHELAEVLPYAVSGEKDGEMMQGVDYSKIVPVLIKAIQELKAEIDSLKTK